MNRFGDRLSRTGPRGPPGRDSTRLDVWCKPALLQMLTDSATASFYFNTMVDGILVEKGKIIGIKDRSSSKKHNAVSLKKNGSIVPSHNTFSLVMGSDECYHMLNVRSAVRPRTVVVVAISFKLTKSLPDKFPYYLFSNENSSRAVTLRQTWMDIAGCVEGSPEIIVNPLAWNRFLIQYSSVNGSSDKCFYILNGKRGTFRPIVYENDATQLYIGHPTKNSAPMMINYFQVHSIHLDSGSDYVLPDSFSRSLLHYMQTRVLSSDES